jgi:dTDP-4-dehydrorhamnose 3,5-epimerase
VLVAEFKIIDQLLPGVTLLQCPHSSDDRGDFTKLFHGDAFTALGLPFSPAESFLTRSKAGVIRGIHFQVGDAAHDKLVCCPKGRVLDVVVDVCPDSAHFNQPVAIELSEYSPTALLIAKGYGHGFLALDDDSWMLYSTTTVHNPALDRGVLWSSIAFDWPVQKPVISERDQEHSSIESLR